MGFMPYYFSGGFYGFKKGNYTKRNGTACAAG